MNRVKTALLCLLLIKCSALMAVPASMNATLQPIMAKFSQQVLSSSGKQPPVLSALSMVAQCRNQAPVYQLAGTLQMHGSKPVKKTSLFQVGSVTKTLVAVVALQLAAEHKLDLDSHKVIAHYFPQYPKWGHITARQLLNMTSGIPGNGTTKGSDIFRHFSAKEYRRYFPPSKVLDLVYKQPLDFTPGTQYEYSNTNYTLLGILIGKITHRSAREVIRQRIIKKLGLKHTYVPVDRLSQVKGVDMANVAHGYDFYSPHSAPYVFQKYGEDTTNFSMAYLNYDGGIVSTPDDINRFAKALFTPRTLLSKMQLAQLTRLVSMNNGQVFSARKQANTLGYGLGLFGFYASTIHSMVYFYQGETNGYNFAYFYVPNADLFVTFAINSTAHVINYQNATSFLFSMVQACRLKQ